MCLKSEVLENLSLHISGQTKILLRRLSEATKNCAGESYTLLIHMEPILADWQVRSTIFGVDCKFRISPEAAKLNKQYALMMDSYSEKLILSKLSPEIQHSYQEMKNLLLLLQASGTFIQSMLLRFLVSTMKIS